MSSSSPIPAPDVRNSADLLTMLGAVADPRPGGGRVHPAGYVLAVMVIALATPGFASLVGAAALAASWPRSVLLRLGARPHPLTGVVRAPAEATIRRMVAALEPDALQGVLDTWTARLRREGGYDRGDQGGDLVAIAIDGKAVRGAKNEGEVAPHLVAAVTHQRAMVLTQTQVAAKTNEIPTVRAMIADLDLVAIGAGAPVVISVDALHTHAATAAAVLDAGGHYVMTVKGNQPRLRTAVITALDTATAPISSVHRSADHGHGRTEERYLRATPAAGIDFPGAAQVMRIVRYRGELGGQRTSKEIVHAITSLSPERAAPAVLAALMRGHWAIENAVHHVRDTTFAEDASRSRTGHAAVNLAALRNAIITAIRAAGATNIAAARRWAATRPYNAIKLLTGRAKRDIAPL